MTAVAYDYEPTPVQARAHQIVCDELLYGGAAGGGKSRWARAEAIRLCALVPGARVVLFRRTFPDLERAVIEYLRAEMPKGIATYNESKHTWKFRNGSILELAYMDRDADKYNYQGAEYQLVIFEELTQFTEGQYKYLVGRLRSAGKVLAAMKKHGLIARAIATANPGGPGHSWVKARWVDAGIRNRVWRPEPTDDEPDPPSLCYVPARVDDNPHVDEGYVRKLNRQEPVMRRALRDGDWDILEGVRFTQFRRGTHVIEPEQLPVPPVGYVRAVGVDYGMTDPFCALWGAMLPDGLLVVYRELYATGLTPAQQAAAIADAEAEGERAPHRPLPLAIDPAMFARSALDPTATATKTSAPKGSIAWYYQQQFPGQIRRARNDRVAGWALIDELLRVRGDGLPRLLIHSTCTNLIRTLPAQMRDKRHPEDIDTHGEDHAADTLRYLAMELIRGGTTSAQGSQIPTKVQAPITAGLRDRQF